jgi:hypothetical protein
MKRPAVFPDWIWGNYDFRRPMDNHCRATRILVLAGYPCFAGGIIRFLQD